MTDFEMLDEEGRWEEMIKLAQEFEDPIEATYWQVVGLSMIGKTLEAIQFIEKTIPILLKGDHDIWVVKFSTIKIRLLIMSGKFFEAKILSQWIVEQDDLIFEKALSLCFLGVIELFCYGNYVLAVDHYRHGEKLMKGIDKKLYYSSIPTDLGFAYIFAENYDLAISNLDIGYKLFAAFNNKQGAILSLALKVWAFADIHKLQSAKEVMELIEDQTDFDTESNYVKLFILYARARILKLQPRLRNKLEAFDLFEEILENYNFHFIWILSAFEHQLELLIDEYKLYEESEVFNRILLVIEYQINFAESQGIYISHFRMLLLHSKFLLIQNKFDEAYDKYNQAGLLAKKFGVEDHINFIEAEKSRFYNEIVSQQDQMQNLSFIEISKKLQLDNYIKTSKKFLKEIDNK